ncbi:Hypothetical_protein [Hexamita inflata]|uniref:Hypothetical_protein n=1 Tax=Hexamita inflata TaxID=28002 RepID=A0AA86UZQ4_9EUKA|nr:Hypothetical protein HINF_LOCUS58202 [Hexamita inflata]
MTEYNRKDSKQEYNEYMIRKYEGNIKDGNLEICDLDRGDPEVTNYMFLEILNIKALKICIKNGLSVKLRNDMIKELTIRNVMDEQQQLIFYVNDLELENLEVLEIRKQQPGKRLTVQFSQIQETPHSEYFKQQC